MFRSFVLFFLVLFLTPLYSLNTTASLVYNETNFLTLFNYTYINSSLVYNETNYPVLSNYTYTTASLIYNETYLPELFNYTYINSSLVYNETNFPTLFNYTYVNSTKLNADLGNALKIVNIISPLNNSYFEENNNTITFTIEAINSLFINSSFIIFNNARLYLTKILNDTYISCPFSFNQSCYTWISTYSNNFTFPEFQGLVPICIENYDGLYICNYVNISVNLPPNIRVIFPSNNSYFNISQINIICWTRDIFPGIKEVRLNITNLTDNSWILYTKTINLSGEFNITFSITLNEGKYKFYCESEDLSNKTNRTDEYYMTIDLTPPNITIYLSLIHI